MNEIASEQSQYRRILLKLSGEALMGEAGFGLDPDTLRGIGGEIAEIAGQGVQVGLVIGGGNLFRGSGLAAAGIDRVTGDQMGMLATVMNGLAMQDVLERLGAPARLMSALAIGGVGEPYDRRRAREHLDAGRVVLFAAGTGNPYFTTDSAASLRAIEIGAQVMLKATKVDGVYSDDPMTNPEAVRYARLTYDEALERRLMVMDATAVVLCRDNGMPLRVFNIFERGNLARVVRGEDVGTLVEQE